VFALGLILYRMLTGVLPEWPYRWPLRGHQKLRRRVHPEMIVFLQRALDTHARKRFRDADQMLRAFRPARAKTLRRAAGQRRRAADNGFRT
jgi:serine/threonine-protein kinase